MNSRDAADGFSNTSGTDIYYDDLSERQYWTMLAWGTAQANINYSNSFAPQLHLAGHSNAAQDLSAVVRLPPSLGPRAFMRRNGRILI